MCVTCSSHPYSQEALPGVAEFSEAFDVLAKHGERGHALWLKIQSIAIERDIFDGPSSGDEDNAAPRPSTLSQQLIDRGCHLSPYPLRVVARYDAIGYGMANQGALQHRVEAEGAAVDAAADALGRPSDPMEVEGGALDAAGGAAGALASPHRASGMLGSAEGPPPLPKVVLSATGLRRAERAAVSEMITELTGVEYSGDMTHLTTHLIARSPLSPLKMSSKVRVACEAGIPLVDLTWITDSASASRGVLVPLDERYLVSSDALSGVLGQPYVDFGRPYRQAVPTENIEAQGALRERTPSPPLAAVGSAWKRMAESGGGASGGRADPGGSGHLQRKAASRGTNGPGTSVRSQLEQRDLLGLSSMGAAAAAAVEAAGVGGGLGTLGPPARRPPPPGWQPRRRAMTPEQLQQQKDAKKAAAMEADGAADGASAAMEGTRGWRRPPPPSAAAAPGAPPSTPPPSAAAPGAPSGAAYADYMAQLQTVATFLPPPSVLVEPEERRDFKHKAMQVSTSWAICGRWPHQSAEGVAPSHRSTQRMPSGLEPKHCAGISAGGSSLRLTIGFIYVELPSIRVADAARCYRQLVTQLHWNVTAPVPGEKKTSQRAIESAAVRVEQLVVIATFDRQRSDAADGTICVLIEMPVSPAICNRHPKWYLGFRLPPMCTVFFGQLPPLLSVQSLAVALLRGPLCSIKDVMQYGITAPGYGSSPASLLAPLLSAKRCYYYALVEPLRLALPFAKVALSQHWAWAKLGEVFLQNPACLCGASNLALNLSAEGRALLAQYLVSAAAHALHFRVIALMVGVNADLLMSADSLALLSEKCQAACSRLKCTPAAVSIGAFATIGELESASAELIQAAMDRNTRSSQSLICSLSESVTPYFGMDLRLLRNSPDLRDACHSRGLITEADRHGSKLFEKSSAWALLPATGIDVLEMLAAFVLLRATCPVDGKPIYLTGAREASGQNNPRKSRRISADRINSSHGLHNVTAVVFISAEMNFRRNSLNL